ncbi:MAG: DegT/DnrJ/EryC1/StrS family aminotransferase [Puniceicoccales bacterium]|nr:DegT/DnrJ/EryC1/StrS family aminotransferase [Puniceicoccales bacterium]
MRVPFLDLKIQNSKLKNDAMGRISKVFDSGNFILSDEVSAFERDAAKYLGAEHAIGVSSGTDAILVALMAIGVGVGDEVICQSFSFFATAGCISRCGATPVFADIEPDSFNISADDVCGKITGKTKAILIVHLFGQMANVDEIGKIASEFGIPIIEDCAQSFGASNNGRQSGTFGIAGCFSFFPTKNLGGFGDSGLVCTNDGDLAEKIKILRVHGMCPRYFHRYISGNFRIDEIQAALLSVKLPHVDGYIANRRRNAEIYMDELADLESIVLPREELGSFHTWNQFTIRILDGKRDDVRTMLEKAGIGCNVYYPLPLDTQECFRDLVSPRCQTANALLASKEVLSLPIFPELTPEQLHHVAKTLKNILRQPRSKY